MKLIYVLISLMLVFIAMIITGMIVDDMDTKNLIVSFVPTPMAVTILGIILELFVFKTYKNVIKV